MIKKNCPDQWSKISQLDGECKNDAVKEEVKGNSNVLSVSILTEVSLKHDLGEGSRRKLGDDPR